MGQIANQMVWEWFLRLKQKVRDKTEEKGEGTERKKKQEEKKK